MANKMRMHKLLLMFFSLFVALPIHAEILVKDLTGREISISQPAKKIILGEGRFLAALGVLGVSNPLDYVVGMMNEFRQYDPTGFRQFQKAYPQIDKIPTFGHTTEDSVSVEKILLLNPDVAIFGVSGHGPGAASRHIIDRLESAGIPIVFIDFRNDPINNTAPSIELIAKLLGLTERGEQFAQFYQAEINKIRKRAATLDKTELRSVLFELRAGRAQECCLTVAKGMFADMARLAGGYSIAEDRLPGPVGRLSKEFVLSTHFDVYIGTAIGASNEQKAGVYDFLLAGPGVSEKDAQQALSFLLEFKGLSSIDSVKKKQAYTLWHHFYNSPLNLYAIQKIATWLHPQLYADLNPEKTLQQLLNGFAPVDLSGVYASEI